MIALFRMMSRFKINLILEVAHFCELFSLLIADLRTAGWGGWVVLCELRGRLK